MFYRQKKKIATIFCGLSILIITSFVSRKQETSLTKPNIIIVLVDDMGFSDIGAFGSEIKTPYLDKLAKGGVRMTHFYNAARCAPSRASLLTGLYPHEAGVGDMMDDFGLPAYKGHISDSTATIAELLKEAGYYSIVSGKWHVGLDSSSQACRRGFDRSFTMLNNGSNYYNTEPLYNDGRKVTLLEDCRKIEKKDEDNFYMTTAITDFALNSLEDRKQPEQPFFLYLTYTAPHWPLHVPQEDLQKYKGKYMHGWDTIRMQRYEKQLKEKMVFPDWKLSKGYEKSPDWSSLAIPEKEIWDTRMAIYAAMIEKMDLEFGRVLKKLEELKQDKNTLILFLSDNGGSADEVKKLSYVHQKSGTPGSSASIDSYGPEWGNVSNTPFSGYKKNMHEGGIASPFIAYFPGVIRPGSISNTTAHLIDIMPTCLEVAGVKYPVQLSGKTLKKAVGKSLLPTLKGSKAVIHDLLFWEHEGNKAIRKGKWKLVADYKKEWELYDMQNDRTETTNLAASHPDVVKELSSLHDKWSSQVGVEDWEKVSSGAFVKK